MYLSLQLSRGLAAILVLLFHLGATIALPKYFGIIAFNKPFSFGDSGVEFFFVLSGFIIYFIHHKDLGKISSFLKYISKRIIRIYPTYLIIFFAVFLSGLLIPSLQGGVPHDFKTILSAVLLFPQNKSVIGGTGAPVLSVAWTLQYEMLFYLAFGIAILNKYAGKILLAIYVFGFFAGLKGWSFPYSFLFDEHIWLFLMGICVAYIFINEINVYLSEFYLFACSGLFYLILILDKLFVLNIFNDVLQTLLYGFAFSLLVLGLVRYESKNKQYLSKYKSVQLIGDASYSLYLIHFPLVSLMCKLAMVIGLAEYGLGGALLTYVITFFVCIQISIWFHTLVEKPVMSYLRKKNPY